MKSIANQYTRLNEGKITKGEFMSDVRSQLPNLVTPLTSFEDTINILKSKEIISAATEQVVEKFDLKAAMSRMNEGQKLKGGKGDKLTADDVNYHEFQKGWKHELEHTDDIEKAKEIALDHLAEDPMYYTRLDMIEYQAKKKNRTDVHLDVKKDQMKDPNNQMEKVKKITTSKSGKLETQKLEEPKKNVGNKKERPKKIKVKTMKESLENIDEIQDEKLIVKGKPVVKYDQNGDSSYNVEYSDGTKAHIYPSDSEWDKLNDDNLKNKNVSEKSISEGLTVRDLKKNEKYTYTGGAEYFDVIYIGTRGENPEIKVGSSMGKGYIFQVGDTPGKYMEFNNQAVGEYIEPLEDMNMSEEYPEPGSPDEQDLKSNSASFNKKRKDANFYIVSSKSFKVLDTADNDHDAIEKMKDLAKENPGDQLLKVPKAKFKQLDEKFLARDKDFFEKMIDMYSNSNNPKHVKLAKILKQWQSSMEPYDRNDMPKLKENDQVSEEVNITTPGRYELVYTTIKDPRTVQKTNINIDDVSKFKKDIASKMNIKSLKKIEDIKPVVDKKRVEIVIPDQSKGQKKGDKFSFSQKQIDDHISKFGNDSLKYIDKPYSTNDPKTASNIDMSKLSPRKSDSLGVKAAPTKPSVSRGTGSWQVVDTETGKTITAFNDRSKAKDFISRTGKKNYIDLPALKVKAAGGQLLPAEDLNESLSKFKKIVKEIFKRKLKEYDVMQAPMGPDVKKKELERLLKGYQWTDAENDYQQINKQEALHKILTLIQDIGDAGIELYKAYNPTGEAPEMAESTLEEDHKFTREEKIDYILSTKGFTGNRSDLSGMSDNQIDMVYKNAEKLRSQSGETKVKPGVDLGKSFDKLK